MMFKGKRLKSFPFLFAEGHAKGLAEGSTNGRAEDRFEAQREIAVKMKAMGDSTEHIIALTGLSGNEISDL